MPRPSEERDLVEGCLEGDQQARDEFFKRHRADLRHTASRRSRRNAREADDVLQQIGLHLCNEGFQSLRDFDSRPG
jgi:DNA-directed RNA polymerase specialized sigma24 family protein